MPPRPLSPAELRLIMAKMRPRDRLIVEWAYLTGIRRMEVAGLRRSALPQVQINPLPGMTIDVTKGDNPRMIHPTLSLIDRTRAYMREERAVAVRHAQKRSAAYTEPDSIFLTDDGLAMSPRRIGAIFYAAAKKAGVEASFHALRHTFATAMLRILQRRAALNPEAEINPLLVLQKLLGHANVATTSIYLRVLQTDMTLVEAAVDDLYEAFR
jgi:integrase/recombinase XerD